MKLCLATAIHNFMRLKICVICEIKSRQISVFQNWELLLLLTTSYTDADKNAECLL